MLCGHQQTSDACHVPMPEACPEMQVPKRHGVRDSEAGDGGGAEGGRAGGVRALSRTAPQPRRALELGCEGMFARSMYEALTWHSE